MKFAILLAFTVLYIATADGWWIDLKKAAREAAERAAEALRKAKELAKDIYKGKQIISKFRTLAHDFKHALGNYGKWCGQKRTRYNKGPCKCGLSRGNIAACRAYDYTKPYDKVDDVCMLHDLCVHCNQPRYGIRGINFALYKHNTNIHWCHCERAVVKNMENSGSCTRTSSSGCRTLKRSLKTFFNIFPCACRVSTYKCWYIVSGFKKRTTQCDSRIVKNYRHC